MAEKLYSYADKQVMDEVGSGGGSGGGTGGSFIVNVTFPPFGGDGVSDKTVDEIITASNEGKIVTMYDGTAIMGYLQNIEFDPQTGNQTAIFSRVSAIPPARIITYEVSPTKEVKAYSVTLSNE